MVVSESVCYLSRALYVALPVSCMDRTRTTARTM